MKDTDKTEAEGAMVTLVREMGVEMSEVVQFISLARRIGRGRLKRAEQCLMAGEEELRRREKTVTFKRAVEAALEERKGRRARTLSDLRYIARRLMRRCRGLSKRRVRGIRSDECREWIEQAFETPSQRKKARAGLSGIFSSAVRRGWCSENPVRHVPVPVVREKRINILTQEEQRRLLQAAETYAGGICMPAVATMLYAGVRPHEMARLTWEQVHMSERVISIEPEHSKTGGARHVSIRASLARVLRRERNRGRTQKICPRNWQRHWGALHRMAGWDRRQGKPWQPDVLRHTFATEHLRKHRSYAELQVEMGHRSSQLLRTRYVAMGAR